MEKRRDVLAIFKYTITTELPDDKSLLIEKAKAYGPPGFIKVFQDEVGHAVKLMMEALEEGGLGKDWIEYTARSEVKFHMVAAAVEARSCTEDLNYMDAVANHWERKYSYAYAWHDILQRAVDEKFQSMFPGALNGPLTR